MATLTDPHLASQAFSDTRSAAHATAAIRGCQCLHVSLSCDVTRVSVQRASALFKVSAGRQNSASTTVVVLMISVTARKLSSS